MDLQPSDSSIGDDLRAAFEQVESNGEPHELPPPIIAPEEAEPAQPTKPGPDTPVPPEGPGPEPTNPGEEPPAKQDQRERDAQGKFISSAAKHPKVDQTAAPKQGEPSATPAPQAPSQPATTELRAPPAWKATARERWSSVPPEIQAEVVKREFELKSTLDQTAEARRFYGAFREVVGPYEGMLRAEGLDPLRGVQSLVQTWAGLRTAPMPHRAQLLANLIKESGVPPKLLDDTLVGEVSSTQPGVVPEYRDPRVDQLLAQLTQQAQQRQVAIQQKSVSEVNRFGEGKEWFEDVRDTMADLLEVAAKRGLEMSLEDAYNAAIQSPLHKDIAEVVRRREAEKGRGTAQATIQRAKIAAGSVRSQPAGAARNGATSTGLPPHEDRKADLEAAFAALDGR